MRHKWDASAVNSTLKRAGLYALVLGVGIAVGATASSLWSRIAWHHSQSTPEARPASGSPPTRVAAVEPANPPLPPSKARSTDRPQRLALDGTQPSSAAVEVAPQAPDRLAAQRSRMVEMVDELARLQQRVTTLERTRARTAADSNPASPPGSPDEPPPLPVDTPQARHFALVSAGVAAELADTIVQTRSKLEMARLELRDQAQREGWQDSERYRIALSGLRGDAMDLREAIGDAVYDQYLFSTGSPNRVRITSVVQGSAAERHGLLPGDVIERYADERIFRGDELRDATTLGERDEVVPVRIRRGDAFLEVWLPRGPIGIRMAPQRLAPEP